MKKTFTATILIVLGLLNMQSLISKLFNVSIGKNVQSGKMSESFASNGISSDDIKGKS